MIINELPEKVSFENIESGETTEITVLLITAKYSQSVDGDALEGFVVVGYDHQKNIHEVFINQCKIIKTKKYERKDRNPRDFTNKRGRTGKTNKGRNLYPADEKGNTENRYSSISGNRDTGKTDGSKIGGQSLL